jgi:5'-nucleotidase
LSGPSRPLILVTNDDGYDAPGLVALVRELARIGRVVRVAPDREYSGASHALTFTRPLRVQRVEADGFRVDGTPTDCVHLGVFDLAGGTPDLVVSGINRGYNVGDDVTYSGTVAGALEGTLLHVPSIAISTAAGDQGSTDYTGAARVAVDLAGAVLQRGLPAGLFLNVNVPPAPVRGTRVTRQGSRTYRAAVEERRDPKGVPYYWIGAPDTTPTDEPDGDHRAVRDGFVSVTPLHANLTHDPSLALLRGWGLEDGAR